MNTAFQIRSSFFLDEAVSDVLCDNYGIVRIFEVIAGIRIPFYLVRRPWGRKVVLGPFNLVPDYADITHDVIATAIRLAKAERATACLRIYDSVSDRLNPELGVVSNIDSFETLVSTKDGLEGIYAQMRPRHRTKILHLVADSSSNGISIRRFDDIETLKIFHNLLTDTYLKRHTMIPPPYRLLRDLFGWRNSTTSTFGYAAERDGRMIGGILLMADPAQWSYAWGATDLAAMGLDVSSLLLHRAAEDAIAARIPMLSLGMTPLSHTGLAQYKRGWSRLERPAGYAVFGAPLPDRDPHTSFHTARTAITRLPKPAIRLLSPLIYWTMV